MPEVVASGRYVRLVRRDGWEWAERTNASGVVVIVAVTPDREVLLVEQHRPPVDARVIEMPAGLAGDVAGQEGEALAEAARRELLEETGWEAEKVEERLSGPVSAGMTSEILTWFVASGLRRVSEGGGDASEDLVVHTVPLDRVGGFLAERTAAGVLVDPKVYTGLWLLTPAPTSVEPPSPTRPGRGQR